jgi:hypothetical protein
MREERRLRVLEKRALRITFGPKKDEATGEWRKCHNEELHDLYSSPTLVRVIRIEKNEMGGVCRVCSSAGGGERRVQGFVRGNLRERDYWGDPDVDGRIILG